MDPNTTVIVFVGVAAALVALGVAMLVRDVYLKQRAHIDRRVNDVEHLPSPLEVLSQPEEDRPDGVDAQFQRLVTDSGSGLTAFEALLVVILCGLGIGGVYLLWRDSVPGTIITAMVGMSLPLLFFVYRRSRRREQMYAQLPGAVFQLARAIRAGESTDQAIRLAGDTVGNPLGKEFYRCARHLDLGLSLSAAIHSMARRVPFMEFRILAAALTVQRTTGGDLPTMLERIAEVITDRQSYRGHFRAATAGGRLAMMVAILLVPAYLLFLIFGQAEYSQPFFTDPTGWWILGGALGLLLIGLLWIASMLRTDY